jgi:hypothetical protein
MANTSVHGLRQRMSRDTEDTHAQGVARQRRPYLAVPAHRCCRLYVSMPPSRDIASCEHRHEPHRPVPSMEISGASMPPYDLAFCSLDYIRRHRHRSPISKRSLGMIIRHGTLLPICSYPSPSDCGRDYRRVCGSVGMLTSAPSLSGTPTRAVGTMLFIYDNTARECYRRRGTIVGLGCRLVV